MAISSVVPTLDGLPFATGDRRLKWGPMPYADEQEIHENAERQRELCLSDHRLHIHPFSPIPIIFLLPSPSLTLTEHDTTRP